MCNLNKYSSGKLIDTKQLKNCNWRIITVPSSVVIAFICYITEPQPDRSSHQRCFVKKSVLRNFAKFTGKHLCQGLFFNKHLRPQPATLLKKETLTQLFPCEFCEISKNIFFTENLGATFSEEITHINHCVLSFGYRPESHRKPRDEVGSPILFEWQSWTINLPFLI